MKKIFAIAAIMLGFAVAAAAQPKAIGIKGGYGAELSYQHYLGGENFLEIDLGLNGFNDFNVTGLYNFNITGGQAGPGAWALYAGPGANVGVGFGDAEHAGHFHLAVAGDIGIEYTFDCHVNLAFDIKAQLGGAFGYGFYFGYMPALAVRYAF